MNATIVPPTDRECERCGRRDHWDDETENWVIVNEQGSSTCIHEWDINGTYNPVSGGA